jgi:glutathione synthase
MRQRHLFIIDPLPSLHPALDTSLHLARALAQRGHATFAAQPWHLSWLAPQPVASVRASRLLFEGGPSTAFLDSTASHSLTDFSGIHMRKDPPFDLDYLAATWELESVAAQVHVMNHPRALREFNEKLAIFRFPDACHTALVSTDADEMLEFIRNQAGGDAVLKPLTLFGGRGVRRIELKQSTEDAVRMLLAEETAGGKQPRLLQPFDHQIFNGEVRAFTMGGEPVAWCLKKPAPGQFLANTRMGARLLPYEPTPEEHARVSDVAGALWKQGVGS